VTKNGARGDKKERLEVKKKAWDKNKKERLGVIRIEKEKFT